MREHYPKTFGGGDGEGMAGVGSKGLIYEAAEGGFGSVAALHAMRIHDFMDIIEYIRTKQKAIKKQYERNKRTRK